MPSLYHVCFPTLVVESSIMASIKIRDPGQWSRPIDCQQHRLVSVYVTSATCLNRASVLPAGGRVADRVGHVPAAQHLHVPAAQEEAAPLSPGRPLWGRWPGAQGGRRRGRRGQRSALCFLQTKPPETKKKHNSKNIQKVFKSHVWIMIQFCRSSRPSVN